MSSVTRWLDFFWGGAIDYNRNLLKQVISFGKYEINPQKCQWLSKFHQSDKIWPNLVTLTRSFNFQLLTYNTPAAENIFICCRSPQGNFVTLNYKKELNILCQALQECFNDLARLLYLPISRSNSCKFQVAFSGVTIALGPLTQQTACSLSNATVKNKGQGQV